VNVIDVLSLIEQVERRSGAGKSSKPKATPKAAPKASAPKAAAPQAPAAKSARRGLRVVERPADTSTTKARLTDQQKIERARIPLTPVDELHPLLAEELDFIQLHRCVLAVYKENTSTSSPPHERLSQAFAICIKSLQNNGYLKPGTREPTAEGKRRSYFKALEPDAVDKQVAYRELLVEAKESRADAKAERSALEGALRGARTGAANRATGMSRAELEAALQEIRQAAEPVFSCSTVWGDCRPEAPSAGHCFMLSMAVQDMLGGDIVFGEVETEDGPVSHYWNRLGAWEFDLTGDQFQEPQVQIKKGKLRPAIAVFDRGRYERLDQEFNKKPMQIYERFCKRLIKELAQKELCDYVDHLKRLEAR
jgi:hypothetical protein